MYSLKTRKLYNPESLWLPISLADQDKAWKKARKQSNAIARYNAYVNRACLYAFLNWLTEWLEETSVEQPLIWRGYDIHTFWEFINGTAILLGETRLVLIPSDPTEMDDLCVPQEWVDIPDWIADYYLGVQVNLDGDEDDCWIEVRGFATHRQLKYEGQYNAGDRTYCLKMERLYTDILVMELTLGLHLQQDVQPLPNLSDFETTRLVKSLGNSRFPSPHLRLTVPFEKWAVLLDDDTCRQQLYLQRITSRVQRLAKVFDASWYPSELLFEGGDNFRLADGDSLPENSIPILIDMVDNSQEKSMRMGAIALLGREANGNRKAIATLANILNSSADKELRNQAVVSLGKIDPDHLQAGIQRAKLLNWRIPVVSRKLVLVITLIPEADETIKIHIRVTTNNGSILPSHLQLVVLDRTGEELMSERSQTNDKTIQLEFFGERGDLFAVKLALGETCITEEFALNY